MTTSEQDDDYMTATLSVRDWDTIRMALWKAAQVDIAEQSRDAIRTLEQGLSFSTHEAKYHFGHAVCLLELRDKIESLLKEGT